MDLRRVQETVELQQKLWLLWPHQKLGTRESVRMFVVTEQSAHTVNPMDLDLKLSLSNHLKGVWASHLT